MPHANRHARLIVIAGIGLAGVLHAVTPAGPHALHWLHLVAAKLYYLPIVVAAAWLGTRATVGVTLVVSALSIAHIVRDWAGRPMIQEEEAAEIATFWLVGVVSAVLFRRERKAREATGLAHKETLAALAGSLELREQYTAGHSRRVRDYALVIAREMGLHDPTFLTDLAHGAFLHDIGKIGIPDRILLKPGSFDEEERRTMRRHPEMGASLVGERGWLRATRALILAHHERYDGTGYPHGLAGEAIPLATRIFSIADAFDALTTDRPYHAALSFEEAAATILLGRGSQFDPDAIDAFLRIPLDVWGRASAGTGVALPRGV